LNFLFQPEVGQSEGEMTKNKVLGGKAGNRIVDNILELRIAGPG